MLTPLPFARRCDPVLLLGLPLRPCARRLAAVIAAIPLPSVSWAKPLFASLQQAPSGPRPVRRPFSSAGRLPFVMPCRILVRAHGRSCSQKLRPLEGNVTPLRGPANLRLMATSRIYLKRPARRGHPGCPVFGAARNSIRFVLGWSEVDLGAGGPGGGPKAAIHSGLESALGSHPCVALSSYQASPLYGDR